MAGAAFGSRGLGRRPVVEIMFGDFLPLVMDSLVNQATKYWFLSGRASVPADRVSVVGAGGRFGAIHLQMPASWFLGVTGLKIVARRTPRTPRACSRSAIRDDNPVLFLEHKRLYSSRATSTTTPSRSAPRTWRGRDGRHDRLRDERRSRSPRGRRAPRRRGIAAEVIDLRTLRPLDVETLLASVEKTNRSSSSRKAR